MMLKVLLIFAICLSGIQAYNRPCPCGWSKILGGCYLFVKNKVTWDVARIACLTQGADLVIPTGSYQCNRLAQKARSLGMNVPWIGIFRRYDKKFINTCGKFLSFTRWNQNEPNNVGNNENCGHMYVHGVGAGKWNDIPCGTKWGYICQLNIPRCAN